MSTSRKHSRSSTTTGSSSSSSVTTFVHAPETQGRLHELLALHSLVSRNIPDDGIDHEAKAAARDAIMDSRSEEEKVLPGPVEREVADYFAFLAGAGAAVCLEASATRGAVVVRLALGEGPVTNGLMESLRMFCGLLRQVAVEGAEQRESTAKAAAWQNVLTFDTSRVHRELTRKFERDHRPLGELFEKALSSQQSSASLPMSHQSSQPFSTFSEATTTASMRNDPRSVLQTIYEQCKMVVQKPVGECIGEVERLLDTCYHARRSKSIKKYLKSLRPRKQLIETIEKLGRHKAATFALVDAARSYSSVFKKLSIEAVSPLPRASFYPPIQSSNSSVLKLASDLGDIPFQYTLEKLRNITEMDSHQLFSKFRELCTTTTTYVHPEVQLVRFYEENPELERPPFIGCSKKSCYLCTVFLELHGGFGFSKSHRTIHHEWAVPRIRCATAQESKRLHNIMEEMIAILEVACRRALGSYEKKGTVTDLPLQASPAPMFFPPVLEPQSTNDTNSSSSPSLRIRGGGSSDVPELTGKEIPSNGNAIPPTPRRSNSSRIPVALPAQLQAARNPGNTSTPTRAGAGQTMAARRSSAGAALPSAIPVSQTSPRTPPANKKPTSIPSPRRASPQRTPSSRQAPQSKPQSRLNPATSASKKRRTMASIDTEEPGGVALTRTNSNRAQPQLQPQVQTQQHPKPHRTTTQDAGIQAPTPSLLGTKTTTRDIATSPPGSTLLASHPPQPTRTRTRDIAISPRGSTLLSSSTRSGHAKTGVTSMAVHISNTKGDPIELEAISSTPTPVPVPAPVLASGTTKEKDSRDSIKAANSDFGPSELAAPTTGIESAVTATDIREQRRREKGKWSAARRSNSNLEDSPTVPATAWLSSSRPPANPAYPPAYPYPNEHQTQSVRQKQQETEYTLYLAGHYTEGLSLGDEVFSGRLNSNKRKNKMVQCKGFKLSTELRPRMEGDMAGINGKGLGRRLSQKEAGVLRAHEVERTKEGVVLDIFFREAVMRLNVVWDEKR